MLVLSRQKDEAIMIGDDVEITVVDIRGDKVRLGIKAPAHIPVHRKEVYEAIKRENKAASQVKPEDIVSVSAADVKSADLDKSDRVVKEDDSGQKPTSKKGGKSRPKKDRESK